MDWFTADTHFGHANIIRSCGRPFPDAPAMDEALLDAINSAVGPDDTLYHLGDFAWRRTEEYRARVRCRNVVLVLGNHDPQGRDGQPKDRLLAAFSGVYVALRIRAGGRACWLSHCAMRVWPGSHHGSWNLHGHSHGKLPAWTAAMDVGVDCNGYRPISMPEVVGAIEGGPQAAREPCGS